MFTDSDYGGDKDKRISVGGFLLYLLGIQSAGSQKDKEV